MMVLALAVVLAAMRAGFCRVDSMGLFLSRFTTFEPPEAASWAFQYRTAWRTPRSAAASRRTSWPRRRRCVQSVKSRLTGNAAAGNAYKLADMASLLQAVRARTT